MRSCLIRLLIGLFIVLALVWIALPWGAGWLATNALNASGFTGTDTHVDVAANPPFILLTGRADSVHLKSTNVGIDDLHASSIDFTLGGVSLLDRTFSSIDGSLSEVLVPAPDGQPVTIESATVQGTSTSALATLKISTAEASRLAEEQLKSQTGISSKVTMSPPNAVTLTAGGHAQPCKLVVADGALQLIPDGGQLPTVILLQSGGGNPFTLTSVRIDQGYVILMGTIDVQSLLGI
jgi:hypothetical protein